MARTSNQEHRELSVSAILNAAEFLFVTRGYNGTTTGDIGKLAGLTKGAVYFYFADKEALLLELLNRVRSNVMEPMREQLRNKQLTPTQRLTKFLEFGGVLSKDSPGSMLLPIVVTIELARSGSTAEQRVKAGYRKVAEEVQAVIKLGQLSGEFRRDLGAEELSRALIATNDGLLLECLRNDLEVQVEKLVNTLNAIILAGVAPQGIAPGRLSSKAGKTKAARPRSMLEVMRTHLESQRRVR